MEPKYRQVPAWIVERYPDLGIYVFAVEGYEAPMLTTQDPEAFVLGRFVVYRLEGCEDFSCGTLLDMRGGLYVLDDIGGRGVCEIPRSRVLGASVGAIINTGEVVLDRFERGL